MKDFGFIKVAAAVPELKVADCTFNAERIIRMITNAAAEKVQIICFPELCVTGYTCGDLFLQQTLIEGAKAAVNDILDAVRSLDITFIIGTPLLHDGKLFNTAVVGYKGKILGYVPKTYLPNYSEFYEKRWFVSSCESVEDQLDGIPFGTDLLFGTGTRKFAVEICEDLWAPIPPSSYRAVQGASLIFNLSASNELTGKHLYRKELIRQQSARCMAGYIYASSGWGESTTDIVYTGNAIISENGTILEEGERFLFKEQLIIGEVDMERLSADRMKNTSFFEIHKTVGRCVDLPNLFSEKEHTLRRKINPLPFVPLGSLFDMHCREVFSIQIGGLAKRLTHTGIKKVVIGVSGGLDSTLALLVCAKTFEKLGIPSKQIIGITMPGFGTTGRTYTNAVDLMKSLGVTLLDISIVKAVEQHFRDIGQDPSVYDITYENSQARERTQILMDIANKENGLVIGTGDMSELALGWATYNGDHMSMYAVNSGIPKTLVKYLVQWIADNQADEKTIVTLSDILGTPVSPELLPANELGEIVQKTEDVIGPYELHDFFLYYVIRFGFSPGKIFYLAQRAFEHTDREIILKWMKVFFKRFFSQQFKRSCLPDGPKVGSINLSPRGDWRMPSDASVNLWMKEIDALS